MLAACAGMLRKWLQSRDELPDQPLIAAVPVSVRTAEHEGQLGNQVSMMAAVLHTDEADLVSRIIEGQFPNYKQVIPTSHSTRVLAQREELLKATRLASYFARDAANMLRFQVDPANEPPLVITANAAEVGDNTGRIDATVEGQATTIAFNSRFVADALSSLTAPEIALELGGPLAPGVVRIVGDDSYLHVVMPLRIPA